MNESDARAVLLLRAFECTPTTLWSETDAAWASDEARRAAGQAATFEKFVVARAASATARLAKRDTKLGAIPTAAAPHGWLAWAALLGALVLGVASDAVGPSDRINILAPPLLGLLVWNCAVYLVLVVRSVGARHEAAPSGPLARALRRTADRAISWMRDPPGAVPAVTRFASDWVAASAALYSARVAAVLHAAAATFVVGALVSMYLRGIAFEFRAGWDSTFLTAENVHAIVAFVLGPAARLSGIELPDVERLARMRFSAGSGENAAAWIHLYALTTGLAIVLPRALLAAVAALRLRAITARFPLSLDDDYFQRLRRVWSGVPAKALVLPYGYQLHHDLVAGLHTALERILGCSVELSVAAPLPHGAEDNLQAWLDDQEAEPTAPAGDAATLVVVVFPLAATPERETHAALVRALAAQRPSMRRLAIVDESEFRRRFTGADGARRLAERRSAWERLLRDEETDAHFADLRANVADSARAGTGASLPPAAAAAGTGPHARS